MYNSKTNSYTQKSGVMIELKDIEFSYRKKGAPALTAVSAVIGPGVHLLAGENGAGKTTLLHLIAGLSRPQVGEVLIDGTSPAGGMPHDMGRTFLVEEGMQLPGKTIRGFAHLHSAFYPNFSAEAFTANLAAFGLSGDEPMKSQSLGNRKKAQLAYALALGVEVLLLDEPTNALDIESKATLRKLIASNITETQTLIISTHTVLELENMFDGGMILSRSRLVFAGTEEAVASRLAFKVSRAPLQEAIYSEIQPGRVLSICRADDMEETRVDWRLFYSALHSPKRSEIARVLMQDSPATANDED